MEKKKKNQYRTERINLRFTKDEKEFIDKRKSQHDIKSYSDFVLSVVANQQCYIIDTNPLLALASEVNAVGQNVNQIAKVAHITRSLYEKDVINLKDRIEEIEAILNDNLNLFRRVRKGNGSGIHKNNSD